MKVCYKMTSVMEKIVQGKGGLGDQGLGEWYRGR